MNPAPDICALCGLPLRRQEIRITWEGMTLHFCCRGCQQVYQMLADAPDAGAPGRFRETALFEKCQAMGIIPRSRADLDHRAEADRAPPDLSSGGLPVRLEVYDMWCPACAWVIEEVLRKTPGVLEAECRFTTDHVACTYDPVLTSPEEIRSVIEKLGYHAGFPGDTAHAGEAKQEQIRLAVSAFLTMNVMMLSFSLYSGFFTRLSEDTIRNLSWPVAVMTGLVLVFGGKNLFLRAARGLKTARFGMETLIAAGALCAFLYSTIHLLSDNIHLYYDTAAMLITLFLLGKLLERRARDRVLSDLGSFFALKPSKVRICTEALPEGRYVAADHLRPGDLFRVDAGEIVPADGLIRKGSGSVDESSLTGEPVPVAKGPGDRLKSGTTVLNGRFTATAEGVGEDSTLGQMIGIIEQAMAAKTPLEGKTDRLLQRFVPIIFALAAATGLFWYLYTRSPAVGMMRAVTVLVISCPCALGIAIPLARVAGISMAGKNGILVRDFASFDTAEHVDAWVFDKTGTVTEGRWRLQRIMAVAPFTESEALSLAAALERASDHYIAAEIRTRAENQPLCRSPEIEEIVCHENGVAGRVNGRPVRIGSRAFLSDVPGVRDFRDGEAAGSTVFMSVDGNLCAVFIFGDTLRSGAADTVQALTSRGLQVSMVSGDGEEITRAVGRMVGIQTALGGMLPQGKIEHVEALRHADKTVAMVGDGVNDAPALSRSDLAVAVHSGSHLGKEVADITLMRGDLRQVTDFLALAARVNRTVRRNLGCAFIYNIIGIPVAMAGLLNPLMAVVAMFLSSMTVIGNTLLLIRKSTTPGFGGRMPNN